jgi:hypothetical protein
VAFSGFSAEMSAMNLLHLVCDGTGLPLQIQNPKELFLA